MKNLKLFTSVLVVLAILLLPVTPPAEAVTSPNPEIKATAALLIDSDTGDVLYSQNPDAKIYPASTTKIMTALLAIEAYERKEIGLDEMITASYTSHNDLSLDGSTQNIIPSEEMSFKNLLYCILVASANEACNIIGEKVSGGYIGDFIELMNKRAKELGATSTHFANTHGLHNPEHYTTANDLYLIVKEALKHPLFAEICNTVTYDIPATNIAGERHITTTNYLISPYRTYYYYKYAKGVKTGSTDEAGHCLISTASKSNINLIAIIMGAEQITEADGTIVTKSFTESRRIYEWAFTNYSKKDVLKKSDLIREIPVKLGKGVDSVIVKPETDISSLLPSDINTDSDLKRDIVIYSERDKVPLKAPITAGQVVGEISISYGDKLLGTSNLISSTAVEMSSLSQVFYNIFQFLRKPIVLVFAIPLFLALLVLIAFLITNSRRLRNRRRNRYRGSYSGRRRR